MTEEEQVIRDWLDGQLSPSGSPLPPSRRQSQPLPRRQVVAVVATLIELLDTARWLRCSSCGGPVPERDATVICLECGDGMLFTANASAPSRCTCGSFVPDSSGDSGCGNCGADEPPLPSEAIR